jgi:hypothetical protein
VRNAICIVSVFQVRPGVMSVTSRQNQVPTLLFKNGTVVPIQQASGQLIGNCVSSLVVQSIVEVIMKCLIMWEMKNGVFWDVTPCGYCKNRRFGGT